MNISINNIREKLALLLVGFLLILSQNAQGQNATTTTIDELRDTINAERYDDVFLKDRIGSTTTVPFFSTDGRRFWYSWSEAGGKSEYHVYEEGKGKSVISNIDDFEPRTYPHINPYGTSPDSLYRLCEDSVKNLYLENLQTGTRQQLTTDGNVGYTFDIVDVKWLDNDKFVIMRSDKRGVRRFSLTYSLGMPPMSYEYDYEIPGDDVVERQQMYFGDLKTGKFSLVNTEKWSGQALTFQKAEGVSDRVYLWREKRTRDIRELCSIDCNGIFRIILTETSKPRINPDMFSCHIIEGKDIFIWSDRTGWGHYYHYDTEGNLKGAVTKGNWTAGRILSYDNQRKELYIQGFGKEKGRNPNYAFVYRVGYDGKNIKLITPENANHSVSVGPQCRLIVDIFSRIDQPTTVCVRNRNGRILSTLEQTDISKLIEYGWKMPEEFVVKAADGVTDLYGIMWKPYDFNPENKYPIISQVYPGPFTETVWTDFTVFDKYHNAALAQRGFIVVVFGHRGSCPHRSKEYNVYGYGNLRDYPLEDDKYGLEQLAKRYSFIDINRVGIVGHSGGAMMSATALMTYPDFYKAAVASSGNYDNTIYNRFWGETYQGIGEDNKFDVKTVMQLAPNLKGHLMLVTGDADQNVHPAHTQRLVEALIQSNKDFELLVLPGQTHHYDYKHQQYFERKKRDFFCKWLKQNEK